MKKIICLLLISLGSLAFEPVIEVGESVNVVGQAFTATARYSQPLSTNQRCEAYGSFAGLQAFELAAAEATNTCKIHFYSSCEVVAVSYREIISREFVGYKACQATVVVRGYRLQ